MAKEKSWGVQQYETILRDAKTRYGAGWALMSDDQRNNYIEARILNLVMGQGGDKFEPAQQLARQVYAAYRT